MHTVSAIGRTYCARTYILCNVLVVTQKIGGSFERRHCAYCSLRISMIQIEACSRARASCALLSHWDPISVTITHVLLLDGWMLNTMQQIMLHDDPMTAKRQRWPFSFFPNKLRMHALTSRSRMGQSFSWQIRQQYIMYNISISKHCTHCQYLGTLRFSLSLHVDIQDCPIYVNHLESSPHM